MTSSQSARLLEEVFLNEASTFKRLLSSPPERADVILIFTGYGLPLCEKAYDLFKAGYSQNICVFGDNSYPWKANPSANAFLYRDQLMMSPEIIDVHTEIEKSKNTKGASDAALEKMLKEGWTSALLVACWYHMPRAYSTFVKTLLSQGNDSHIVPAPYEPAAWQETDPLLEMSWTDALNKEKERMERYRAKADVATIDELNDYVSRHFDQSTFISKRFLRPL